MKTVRHLLRAAGLPVVLVLFALAAATTADAVPASGPEISITANYAGNVEIASGDTTPDAADNTHFGTLAVPNETRAYSYTITNKGDAPLHLTGSPKLVAITGRDAGDFILTIDATSPVESGAAASFTITFDPTAPGPREALVTVANDDSDEGNFTFAIAGVGSVTPGVAVGLNATHDALLHFTPLDPRTVQKVPLTGVTVGELLAGLDRRPSTGELMGLGVDATADSGTLYTIDPATGLATPVGLRGGVVFANGHGAPVDFPDPLTTAYDLDIDPTTDRVRVVTSTGLNFSVYATKGAPVDGNLGSTTLLVDGTNPDGQIQLGAGGPVQVEAIGYTNSPPNATATTLYTIDGLTGTLYIQSPPSSGSQTAIIPLTLQGGRYKDFAARGFDIPSTVSVATSNSPASGFGWFTSTSMTSGPQICRVNLASGDVTVFGTLPEPVSGFTLLVQLDTPTLATPTATALNPTGATLGGNVLAANGAPVDGRGFVFALTSENAGPVIGGTGVVQVTTAEGTGAFSSSAALLPGQSYSYRAFAHNAVGTGYSSVATLVTPIAGIDDAVAVTRGVTRLYPLANDAWTEYFPPRLVSVSNPAIQIEGRALLIPAGFAGTFTYTYSDYFTTGQAKVTVSAGVAVSDARTLAGLLVGFRGESEGAVNVTFTPSGRVATVRVSAGSGLIQTIVTFPAGASTASRATALGRLTLTRNPDGTVSALLESSTLLGFCDLKPRLTRATAARYNIALADTDPQGAFSAGPGGGYAFVNTYRSGAAAIIGRLLDGQVFSTGTSVCEDGTLAFHGVVRHGVNPPPSVAGQLLFADLITTDLTGELTWDKPIQRPGARGLNLDGVYTTLSLNGSRWNQQSLPTGTGVLRLEGGNLGFLPEETSLPVFMGHPTTPTGSLRTWVTYPKLGIFLARVKVPGLPLPVLGAGVYLPKSSRFWGFFPGTTEGGQIDLPVR